MKFERLGQSGRSIVLSLLVVVVLIIALYPVTSIEVSDPNSHKTFRVIKIDTNFSMEYSYIHSASMTPVIEHMVMTKDWMLLTHRVDYRDQSGAGLPEYVSDGAVFRTDGEWFIIEDMSRIYKSHLIHVNQSYDNRLVIDGESIKLYEYFDRGRGVVEIKVKVIPRLVYYMKKG